MDFSLASVVPRRGGELGRGACRGRRAGRGDSSRVPGIRRRRSRPGERSSAVTCGDSGLQFEATKDKQEAEAAVVADQPVDERGRKRRLTATEERMAPHNDGFGFGDFGPDYLFLWCGRPDAYGEGASFLVDGLRLLELMAGDPEYRDVARFAWETGIDQSEPNFPLAACAPDPPPPARVPGGPGSGTTPSRHRRPGRAPRHRDGARRR